MNFIGGGLSIYDNPQLTSVEALSNITSLGGLLAVYNTQLTSLEGLHNINSISGGLSITSNTALTDISALDNIDALGIIDTGVYIVGNTSLWVCNLHNLCTYLNYDPQTHLRNITGNAGTCYESAVVDYCLDLTVYCAPVPEWNSINYGVYINSFITSGGETNISNTDSSFSAAGYGNFSDTHSVSQYEGGSISFSVVRANVNPTGLRIWLDWNNDGIFNNDSSEIVYTSPETFVETHSGSFTVPAVEVGNYRMRVMVMYDELNIDSCQTNFFGETEDYTLTVLLAPSNCLAYTIWSSGSWSNGVPNDTKKAIIDGDFTLNTDLTACELEVTENGSLTIGSGRSFTIIGKITNNATKNDFVVENNGILLQVDDEENEGEITVIRNSNPMFRLDYTLWSSPVDMLLKDFSEVSPSGGYGTLWNRVYTLGAEQWEQVWNSYTEAEAGSDAFVGAKGYLYRSPNEWVVRNNSANDPAQSYEGIFTGVPNNGTITLGTPLSFNAVGNPYPSPIFVNDFIDGNFDLVNGGVEFLYFWTNVNPPVNNTYNGINNWAYYSKAAGGTGVDGQFEPLDDMNIQPGQGFVISVTNGTNDVTFTNDMRTGTNGAFFKMMTNEKHRFWLNLSNEEVTFNQILVGYIENATQGIDTGIDAKMFSYEGNAIYSIIENSEEGYVIQGRELPFEASDVVPLGFRAVNAGSYTISLNNFDGLFDEENQDIYLKDNLTQTTHNLKNGAYTFVSEEGIFDTRFEVVYQTGTMSTENPNLSSNWIVYKQDRGFQVQLQGFEMQEVSVYDMLGRVVYSSKAEGTAHTIPVLGADGVFIVKVTTTEDKVLNKKVR